MHDVELSTGGFGNKLQELLYVEKHELGKADKTRVALVSCADSRSLSSTDARLCTCRGMEVTVSTSTILVGRHLSLTCAFGRLQLRRPTSAFAHVANTSLVLSSRSGHNSIFMYNVLEDGTLDLIADCPSFGDGHDGPRHVVPSPDGSVLYAVTEHSESLPLPRPPSLHH